MLRRVVLGVLMFCVAMLVCLAAMGVISLVTDFNPLVGLAWCALVSGLAGSGVFCFVWADDIAKEKHGLYKTGLLGRF